MSALAVRLDVGQERLDAVDGAHEVDADQPVPVRFRDGLHWAADADAGVVADEVDLAEGRERRFGGAGDRGAVRHVADDGARVGAGILQLAQRGVERALLDVGQHHFRSLSCERAG
jgi:hypothetical protein